MLRHRADLLARKVLVGEAALSEVKELNSLREALSAPSAAEIRMLSSSNYAHANEAGRKLINRIRYNQISTKADLVQLQAMREFPEFKAPDQSSRRLCFLYSLSKLGLANAEQNEELMQASSQSLVANA